MAYKEVDGSLGTDEVYDQIREHVQEIVNEKVMAIKIKESSMRCQETIEVKTKIY